MNISHQQPHSVTNGTSRHYVPENNPLSFVKPKHLNLSLKDVVDVSSINQQQSSNLTQVKVDAWGSGSNDHLIGILKNQGYTSKEIYGGVLSEVATLNGLKNPNLIQAGSTLKIPRKTRAAEGEPQVQADKIQKSPTSPVEESTETTTRKGNSLVDQVTDFASGLYDKITGNTTPHRPEATVAVIDGFRDADKDGVTTHGEKVEAVIAQKLGLEEKDIRRIEAGSMSELDKVVAGFNNLTGNEDGKLTSNITNTLENVGDALQGFASDPDSKITTANTSLGLSPSLLSEALWDQAQEPKARQALSKRLGLENPSDKELLQAITDYSSKLYRESDAIAEAKQKYDQQSAQAKEAGISQTISAGNAGDFAQILEKHGVEVDGDFYQNLLSNEHNTTVGAFQGQAAAYYSNPSAGAEVAAQGTHSVKPLDGGAEEVVSGTSFSAPDVAAELAYIAQIRPDLTAQQREDLLIYNATPMGDPNVVGAGHAHGVPLGVQRAE